MNSAHDEDVRAGRVGPDRIAKPTCPVQIVGPGIAPQIGVPAISGPVHFALVVIHGCEHGGGIAAGVSQLDASSQGSSYRRQSRGCAPAYTSICRIECFGVVPGSDALAAVGRMKV